MKGTLEVILDKHGSPLAGIVVFDNRIKPSPVIFNMLDARIRAAGIEPACTTEKYIDINVEEDSQ